ncbi:hypothetical protein D9615_007531 [Tricholomella constricta]|uniref:Uncharacterized protein n=1 Tax=Tricholomella constricta TaxID=117010 RepID=A0A8H5M275_9AGAR|nr:hypothetical protein D9615_007531 [Tricholomella constricta]
MADPLSSPTTPQGFELLDFHSLGKVTTKTFERLAPFSQLQNPSSHDAGPAVIKVVNKIKTYLDAIDTSIQVVHSAYQMSKLAATLWDEAALARGVRVEEKRSRQQQQQRLEDLVTLADEAHENAKKADGVLRQVEQDFYRIAASTKDVDATVQVPVDPALRASTSTFSFLPSTHLKSQFLLFMSTAKTIKKSLKDVGSDLVANLHVLAEFARQTDDMAAWCGWIKASIIALDGTVVPPQDNTVAVDANAVRARWAKVRADCLVYHSMIAEVQDRYAAMLPRSTTLWQVAMREANNPNYKNNKRESDSGARGLGDKAGGGVARKMVNLFRDAVGHLSCHACHGGFV